MEGKGGAKDKRTRTEGDGAEKAAAAGRAAVTPFGPSQLSAGAVQLLLGAAVDTWDRVRDGACRLLAMYPAPLPGTCFTHCLDARHENPPTRPTEERHVASHLLHAG